MLFTKQCKIMWKGSGMQKLNQEIPKQTTEKAKMSDVKCQIIILARFHWRKHEQTRFRSITSCIRKRYHENPLTETCVSLRKHTEKWSGSVVSAATETWINDMYPLPETHVSRCVSATLSCVSATFQSADSWHFVLCFQLIIRRVIDDPRPSYILVPAGGQLCTRPTPSL